MSAVVNSSMRDFWNDAGGRMWLEHQDMIEASMSPLGIKAMDELSIADGERVLDIGCGCGDTTFEIAQRIGKSGYVLGADISEMLVLSANNMIKRKLQSNMEFACVDAQIDSLGNATFDAVFSRLGVMFFDNPVSAFTNIRHSLRPGGRMAFVCWQPVRAIEWIRIPLDVVARHVDLPAPEPDQPEAPGGFSFGDESRVINILDSAGFVDVKVAACNIKMNIGRDLDEAEKFLTHIGPAGRVLDNPEIDRQTRTRFSADLRESLRPYLTRKGVKLGAASWLVTASRA